MHIYECFVVYNMINSEKTCNLDMFIQIVYNNTQRVV